MGRQGQKRKVVAAEPEFDEDRFSSKEAEDRYKEKTSTYTPIPERGIQVSAPETAWLRTIIQRRGWKMLCQEPKPASLKLVKEFYANLIDRKDDKVFVRGTWVPFDSGAINAIYKTKRVLHKDDAFASGIRVDWDGVAAQLCSYGATWVEGTNEKSQKHLLHQNLSKNAKTILEFICCRLMPTRNRSEVTRERAHLISIIDSSQEFDVGSVISNGIIHSMAGKSLCYPHLITRLCEKAGITNSEELLPPKSPIDDGIYKRFKDAMVPSQGGPAGMTQNEEMTSIQAPAETSSRRAPRTQREALDELAAGMTSNRALMEQINRRVLRSLRFQADMYQAQEKFAQWIGGRLGDLSGMPPFPDPPTTDSEASDDLES